MPYQDGLPFSRGSHTSHQAAVALRREGTRGEKMQQLIDAYRDAGERGLTNLEASMATGLPLQSVCSLAHALQDCGVIVKGQIRVSAYGKPNQAWIYLGCST